MKTPDIRPRSPQLVLTAEAFVSDYIHSRLAGVALALTAVLGISGCASGAPDSAPTVTQTVYVPETQPPVAQPTESPHSTVEVTATPEKTKYPLHTVTATIFGIGEKADASNDYITNEETAWWAGIDKATGKPVAVAMFGGVDDINNRNANGLPKTFVPKLNPYYFALPANEFDEKGPIKGARESSPWSNEKIADDESLFLGRWIKVEREGKIIYAQWVDTGPNEEEDYKYVFGANNADPKNTFGLKAGLDLSPTASHDLGFSVVEGGAEVTWNFVDQADVPKGPWSKYSAISNKPNWQN